MPGRDAVGIGIAAVRARRLRVSGLVLDSQAVPVPSANGAFSRTGGLTATSHGFTADAAGRFAVAAVEPGEYTLVVGGGSWSTPIASTGRPETAELPMTIATDADDIVVVDAAGDQPVGTGGAVRRCARLRPPECGLRSAEETVLRCAARTARPPSARISGFRPTICSARGWCACPGCPVAGRSRPSC